MILNFNQPLDLLKSHCACCGKNIIVDRCNFRYSKYQEFFIIPKKFYQYGYCSLQCRAKSDDLIEKGKIGELYISQFFKPKVS